MEEKYISVFKDQVLLIVRDYRHMSPERFAACDVEIANRVVDNLRAVLRSERAARNGRAGAAVRAATRKGGRR